MMYHPYKKKPQYNIYNKSVIRSNMNYTSVLQMFLMIFSGTAILTTLMVIMMSAMMEENGQ